MNRRKYLLAVLFAICIHLPCPAQDFSNIQIQHNLEELDKNQALANREKLILLYEWENKSLEKQLPQDSVYARLLHKIAALEYLVNRNYNTALSYTLRALQINTSGNRGGSGILALTDYYNLAYYYDQMNLFKKALLYYDSAIRIAEKIKDKQHVKAKSRIRKAYIFFRMGDYEKATEESDLGVAASLETKDSLNYLYFLNQRAQALFFQNKLSSATQDLSTAISLARFLDQPFELASAWKIRGFIYAKTRKFPQAEAAFKTCIAQRNKTRDYSQISSDYNDLGNFYSDSMKSYKKADESFTRAVQNARLEGDSTRMARATLNQGRSFLLRHDLNRALVSFQQTMIYLRINKGILENPSAKEIAPIGNKEMIQFLFNSKTALLLKLYKERHDQKWLDACIRSALLNDSLILQIRHELLGEQSKLYWRERTRQFYSNAIEAGYLANDHRLVFFFMEKSRSVLLQDKLNELGASAFLPPAETARLENLQISITELQEKLSTLPESSAEYKTIRVNLLKVKEDLEQYIKSLEKMYPVYYQYKYADNVRSLSFLQNYLRERKQRFIEYFIQDTNCFALCVGPDSSRLIRISNDSGDNAQLMNGFIHFCSNEDSLNKNFPRFLASSNNLYNLLFSPFRLSPGRVIICQDKYLVPFEALSSHPGRADFLIHDYTFSYVFSAQYLMNPFELAVGKGDFLGIAPVRFGKYGGLPDLELSADALRNCSASYDHPTLLLDQNASRNNFLKEVSLYNTVTILTHARADSLDNEPLLYMSDSVIHLSELQMLNKPSTKLIVLSACQTNTGRSMSGEGIYSLARGFSSAGIPSVAATQWVADDQAIYAISEKFNQFIADGMNKDEALQKAKLFYLQHETKNKILPYYWADLILIGNSDPVLFSKVLKWNWIEPLIILALIGVLIFIYSGLKYFRKLKRYRK
jgi:CHAT domain-containing protein/tetratricopeptide (TPR) repeat protein